MLKKLFFIVLLSISIFQLKAQTISQNELENILSKTKIAYLPAEDIDALYVQLENVKDLNSLSDSACNTFGGACKNISTLYTVAFHYKPALSAYYRYLDAKALLAERERKNSIASLHATLQNEQNDNLLKKDAQKKNIDDLAGEIKSLEDNKEKVVQVTWLVVISIAVLSGILLLIFVRRAHAAAAKLKLNRGKMRELHRISALGEFCESTMLVFEDEFEQVAEISGEIKSDLKKIKSEAAKSELELLQKYFSQLEKNADVILQKLKMQR